MALLTYVRDVDSNTPLFAVIADDDGADYLFPDDVDPWLDEQRITDLEELTGTHPNDEAGWLELATTNMGQSVIDQPTKFADVETAVTEADKGLAQFVPVDGDKFRLDAASDAFDQVSVDYPGFGEDDESLTPEAMNNYVSMMLGPIDPEGPNGWVLRAQDGNPEPGDEDQFLHFPGEPDDQPDPEPSTGPVPDDETETTDEADTEEPENDEPALEPDDEESEPVPDDEQAEEPE